MKQGTVKWFNSSKGFGFITDGKNDYFAHFRSIESDGFKTLREGQRVTFTAEDSPKGAMATHIVTID